MENRKDRRGLTEAQAIARYRNRNYPKPALTADVVLFRKTSAGTAVLLVRRGNHPFLGCWALPGGFAMEQEPVEETAARELAEETGVPAPKLELVGVFSKPGRDPRGWVVSAAYAGLTDRDGNLLAGDDAADACWFTVRQEREGIRLSAPMMRISPEDLAFDHGEILEKAMRKLGV